MATTVCLIHGNWHDGSSWTPLAERLRGRGYRVVAADLPSYDPAPSSHLRPGAFPVGDYPLTAHPNCPTALIYTGQDEFFNPAWERYVAHQILGIEPIELPGGHFPMQEDPDILVDALDRLIKQSAL